MRDSTKDRKHLTILHERFPFCLNRTPCLCASYELILAYPKDFTWHLRLGQSKTSINWKCRCANAISCLTTCISWTVSTGWQTCNCVEASLSCRVNINTKRQRTPLGCDVVFRKTTFTVRFFPHYNRYLITK